MEFKGTKGEWKVDLRHEHESYIRCNGLRIAEVKHFTHKDLNDPSKEEGRANAKLIEAAPDMLNALLQVKRILEKSWTKDEYIHFANEETCLTKAINKALK